MKAVHRAVSIKVGFSMSFYIFLGLCVDKNRKLSFDRDFFSM